MFLESVFKCERFLHTPQYVPPVEPFNMWNNEALNQFKIRAKMDLVDNYKTYITNKPSNNW